MTQLSPYMLGYYEASEGFKFSKNPFSHYADRQRWMAWAKGWLEYNRNNND